MRAGLAPPAPRRRWRRRTASRPIVGEGNGSRTPSAATENDPRAGERRVGASASLRSKLDFRLEHELQPWWDGSAPPRGSRGCFCCRLAPEARIAAGGAPDTGCLLLEGSALPRAPHPSARHHERRNGRRRRPPPLMAREHCGGCAGCPDGDRTGTCQHILLKAAGGELASCSADLPRDLRRLMTARATGRISPAPYLVI
jgi:hypothetical protein